MRNAAYIIDIVTTVIFAWMIIPLAWMIPMTIATKKTIDDKEPHIALGVCHIFFMFFVSGILILIPEN